MEVLIALFFFRRDYLFIKIALELPHSEQTCFSRRRGIYVKLVGLTSPVTYFYVSACNIFSHVF
jgi:hypothetical protein